MSLVRPPSRKERRAEKAKANNDQKAKLAEAEREAAAAEQAKKMPEATAPAAEKITLPSHWSEWKREHLNALPYMQSVTMPDDTDLKKYDSPSLDLRIEMDSLVDGPSITPYGTRVPTVSPSDKELLTFFRSIESKAKVAGSDTNNNLYEAAIRLTLLLSTSGSLSGWKHADEYITDKKGYLSRRCPPSMVNETKTKTRTLPGAAVAHAAAPAPAIKTQCGDLIDKSEQLLRAAFMRAKWVLEVEKKEGEKQADGKAADRVLGVLLKDLTWMNSATKYINSAGERINYFVEEEKKKTTPLLAEFIASQQRGFPWPHSPNIRSQFQQTGFMYRQGVIKRDRFVCEACGTEVCFLRPWHNPWLMHDWTKPHAIARPPGTPAL